MKKILILTPILYVLILVGAFVLGSCVSSIEPDFSTTKVTNENKKTETINKSEESLDTDRMFSGTHKLAKIKNDKYLYLYGVSDIRSLYCMFVWETNGTFYSSNYIMFSKVKFEIDSNITEPYIKFIWEGSNTNYTIQNAIYHYVDYIIIVTNNDNFQEIITYGEQQNRQNVSSDN